VVIKGTTAKISVLPKENGYREPILTVESVTRGASGRTEVAPDGTILYFADTDRMEVDFFLVRLRNQEGRIATKKVNVFLERL
jgi:hypothetical protein